jgi:large exoprotein involved in heme utilization and adhesion
VVVGLVGATQGQAGNILVETKNLTISGGGLIRSGAENFSTGNAGSITIQGQAGQGRLANSVLIDGGGSGIFTDTQGTGAGGNISVNANSFTLQNDGTLSAKTSGTEATAIGGAITVTATNQVTMSNGASITASSSGFGNAGNILINAGQQLDMQGSSIKTEATHASGGNIDIQAVNRVRLVNSAINTSVLGGGGSGGNITIDPNIVVLQNSQILAQAVQGAGGNITITTPLFLADQTSLVSASSQFGLNGTVTIQNPTSNLSESLGPLPSSMLEQQALQAQRCAALHGGASSSFIIAGRDTVPTEPGGWLATSLGLYSLGHGFLADTMIDEQPPTTLVMAEASESISLRRLTPIGFLTQRFAGNGSDGCRS